MANNSEQLVSLLLPISTFVLVLSVWIVGVILWSTRRIERNRRIQERIGLKRAEVEQRVLHLWQDGKELTTSVESAKVDRRIKVRLEQAFREAGLKMTGSQILFLLGGIVAITVPFGWIVTGKWFLGLGAAGALLTIVRIVILGRIASKQALFDSQLIECLELASRSLRAGHPLLGAFHLLSEEMAPPIRDIFLEICQTHEMGASLEDVLREKGRESSSPDLKLFATSVAIQMRSGGNLADLMDRLALVIRERIRGQRRVRTLSAQTQLSKRILLALPVLMFIVLNFINPKYMQPFYEVRAAQIMLSVAVGLLVLGAWVMNKMVQLKT